MSKKHLNIKHKDSLFKMLQINEETIDKIIAKYRGSDYAIDLKEDPQP